MADETVTAELILDARKALKGFDDFYARALKASGAVDSLQQKIAAFQRFVLLQAQGSGKAFEQELKAFKELDNLLRSGKQKSIFGKTGGVDPFAEVQKRYNSIYGGAGKDVPLNASQGLSEEEMAANKAAVAQAGLANASTKAGEAGEKGAQRATFATRAWSIAIGMLIHQGLNLLINTFQKMVTMAISGLRELETATYNLVNAERALSEQGVDITPKGLDETIKKLQILDPLLSKTQATEVVSRAASLVAPNVGFNAKEIDQFSRSVAVLAVKNRGLGKSFEEVESQISNAFLSGRVSVGINQLGVKITDQIVKDEALRMGLVKNADAFDKLTGKIEANVKARAMLSVLAKATNRDEAHLPEFFKTADAQFGIFQARLQDVFTKIGTLIAPILIRIFNDLANGLEKLLDWMEKNSDALTMWVTVADAFLQVAQKGIGLILKFGTAFGYMGMMIANAGDRLQKFIDKYPLLKKLAGAWGFQGISAAPDTPTERFGSFAKNNDNLAEAQKKAEEKINDIMKENRDKRMDIERNYQEKLQDIALNYSQKLQDIARDTARKEEDAYRDYGQKIEDINRDAAQRAEDAKAEAHRTSVENERKYQQELKDLQQKFLMDLEEALHNRDARAILKLIQQHNLEKQKLEERRKEERQREKEDLALKLQQIELERKQKLEAAQRELNDKLEQIRLAAQRERQDAAIAQQRALADARIAYQRQLAEQRLYLQRKLQDLAAALAQELQLTAAQQAALADMMNTTTGGTATNGVFTSATPVVSDTWANAGLFGTTGMAEGGSFLATRPQTLNVAENRPELITATPLGRPGMDVNKLFADVGLGGVGSSGGGQMEIGISLSPDLEARVVKKSLDEAANVVLRVNRSKV